MTQSVGKLTGLKLFPVEDSQQSTLYNALIDRYHYLGYTPMAGAQIRYLFSWDGGVLGCIGFGASDNLSTQKSYSDITQKVENTIRTEGVDGKALKDRAKQITGAAALSAMLVGNGIKSQLSQTFRGSELDAYNKDRGDFLERSEDIKQQIGESEISRKGKDIKDYKGNIVSEEAQALKTNIKESMDEFTKKIFPGK